MDKFTKEQFEDLTGLSGEIGEMSLKDLMDKYNNGEKINSIVFSPEEFEKAFGITPQELNKEIENNTISDYDIDRRNEIAFEIFLTVLSKKEEAIIGNEEDLKKFISFSIDKSFEYANDIIKRGKSHE